MLNVSLLRAFRLRRLSNPLVAPVVVVWLPRPPGAPLTRIILILLTLLFSCATKRHVHKCPYRSEISCDIYYTVERDSACSRDPDSRACAAHKDFVERRQRQQAQGVCPRGERCLEDVSPW